LFRHWEREGDMARLERPGTQELAENMTEVLAYGTAVIVEPN